MALADIIARIEADAAAEAAAVEDAAHERAEAVLASARAKAAAYVADAIDAAQRDADRDAETLVVNARLKGRDALVTARRELMAEALDAAVQRIAELPDDEYARFLAARIVAASRGGETVAFGAQDAARAQAVFAEVGRIAPDLGLSAAEAPAPFARGALLAGDRVRVDLSLLAIIAERADELELIAAAALFGEEA